MSDASSLPDHRAQRAEALERGQSTLGLSLSLLQQEKLLGFVDLIVQWNRTYNLTAIREPMAMLNHHILDCLAIVLPMRRRSRALERGGRVLDVGSGAGLPGVVLAIAAPEAAVVCVDSVGKKAAFITQAAATLGLANLSSRHSRVESLREPAFDVIVSRAFASLADFARTTRHLLADDGWWLAMKGDPAEEELHGAQRESLVFHVEPLAVPGLDAHRSLVWMQQESVRTLSRSASA